jgi:hypothetical protein
MERNIAVYNYDGELVQWMDEKRLQRLIDCGRVARVVKNRVGRIKRATLHRMADEPKPSTLRDYMGTKYSFREHLVNGHRCYRLRGLGDNPRAEHDLAPEEVRPIFLRVVTDCLSNGGSRV